ncbi:NAD-dependent epimerase/dehydratase family protein [Endothiovibrio diazotrophicus]
MNYLVTGGAGFIGSHLVETLLARGERVRVLDNFSSGSWDNLASVREEPRLEVIDGDVCRTADTRAAMEGIDVVFHLAALVSVAASVEEPLRSFTNNTLGTFKLFEAARQSGVARVIYASSAAVYGDNPNTPLREEEPALPLSPYALDKSYAEQLAGLYFRLYGIESAGLRYFNVFGPRQDPSSPYSGVISIFIDHAHRGESVAVHGDGGQTRDFVFVTDVVAANIAAADKAAMGAVCYNIGTGTAISINELVERIGEVSGRPVEYGYGSARGGDIRHSVADVRRAQRELDWVAQRSISDGLAETYAAATRGGNGYSRVT